MFLSFSLSVLHDPTSCTLFPLSIQHCHPVIPYAIAIVAYHLFNIHTLDLCSLGYLLFPVRRRIDARYHPP